MNAGLMRRVALGLAAPVVSVVVALAISSIVLELSGSDAYETFKTMISNGTKLESIVDMLNRVFSRFDELAGRVRAEIRSLMAGGTMTGAIGRRRLLRHGDVLVLTAARGESWITVSEAGGKVLLRRLVASGETVKLSGSLPLSVVVGRASNVDVLVRGKAFDLAPLARSGGVARFEVKS